jgi:hypothetical protein
VIEGGTKQLTFHGVPIVWNPEFSDLDTLYAPSTLWEKRCYFINGRHLKLRPIEGQDMITRKPPARTTSTSTTGASPGAAR